MTTVVFDLGKVLVDFDYGIAARRIAARSNGGTCIAQFTIEHSDVLVSYELGTMDTPTFFGKVRAKTGFRGELEEFGECFADIFVPIPEMVELHAEVKRRGYPTWIFSNTNELAIRHIRRSFPFFSNFDGYIYSYEHGALKPDAALYEAIERGTGCRGSEIVYLDDRPENIATGLARGWRAILHQTPRQSRDAVEQMGLFS